MTNEPKKCGYCNTPLIGRARKWCSRTCLDKARTEQRRRDRIMAEPWRAERRCKQCKRPIPAIKNPSALYCSTPCRGRWRYENMSEEARKRSREWYLRNPERHREICNKATKRWRERNPELARIRNGLMHSRRKARMFGNRDFIDFNDREVEKLLIRFNYSCAYCGERPKELHLDHVVPLAKGGRHAIANILPACPSCNLSKKDKYLSDWRRWKATVAQIEEVA